MGGEEVVGAIITIVLLGGIVVAAIVPVAIILTRRRARKRIAARPVPSDPRRELRRLRQEQLADWEREFQQARRLHDPKASRQPRR